MGELTNKLFLDSRKAEELLEKGYLGADLHVHSSASSDVIPSPNVQPEAIIRKEKSLGLLPMISDHDTMDGLLSLDSSNALEVSGVEIKIKSPDIGHTIHTNIYGLKTAQLNDLENIALSGNIREFISYIKNTRLPFQYNHPFWCEPDEKLNISAVKEIAKEFPVIELNSGRIRSLNDSAYRLARELGKGITSTTDSHIGEPGKALTLAQGSDFFEFWDNVIHGNLYVMRYDMTIPRVAHEIEARILQYMDCDVSEFAKKDWKTGIRLADMMLGHLTSEIYKKNNALKKIVSFAAGNIIGPNIAAALLIIPQNITAYEINNMKKFEKNSPIGRPTIQYQESLRVIPKSEAINYVF